jgi:lysozyme family protein
LLADCLISDLQHSSLSVQVFIHENASIKRRASRVAKSRGTRGADNAFRVTSPRKSLTGE